MLCFEFFYTKNPTAPVGRGHNNYSPFPLYEVYTADFVSVNWYIKTYMSILYNNIQENNSFLFGYM